MGTLTANCPRLAEHCPHKLPSSCRLTSTPLCCACADIRPHTTTYRIYIDGVGYVNRGTRWQSYCWFCKSFWDARVTAAGLLPSTSRIPEDPDQTEFVDRWFEWHQGYRIHKHDDGRVERLTMIGQPLRDADPGFLPWSAEELSQGQRHTLDSDSRRRLRLTETSSSSEAQLSLEDELDRLMGEVDDEDSIDNNSVSVTEAASTALPIRNSNTDADSNMEARTRLDESYAMAQRAVDVAQAIRDRAEAELQNADTELTMLRERSRRIRRQQTTLGNYIRVFGTREDVNSEDYVSPITSMFLRQAQWARMTSEERAANRFRGNGGESQGRGETRQDYGHLMGNEHALDSRQYAHTSIRNILPPSRDGSIFESSATGRDRQTTSRTNSQSNVREMLMDAESRNMETESPSLPQVAVIPEFRAHLTHPVLHQHPASQLPALLNETNPSNPTLATIPPQSLRDRPANSPSRNAAPHLDFVVDTTRISTSLGEQSLSPALSFAQENPNSTTTTFTHTNNASNNNGLPIVHSETLSQQLTSYVGLDADDTRPRVPRTDAEMNVRNECKICLQQIAEIACLPCGHLSMCTWCADQWIPAKEADRTRPRDKGIRCPCCRKGVKSRVRIYVG